MKRKLFIGSSSEGLSIARQLKTKIEDALGDWIEVDVWDEGKVFTLNKSALDTLVKASRKYDYGVLVATKDDIAIIRRNMFWKSRDNVMFELGLFLGSLGLTRAFLLLEEKTKLPTDYNGISVPYFQRKKAGSLGVAIEKVINAIKATRLSYNLKPVPSAALALGYFENFLQPLAKKRVKDGIDFNLQLLIPQSISDIRTQISTYRNSNPSDEISVYDDDGRPRIHQYVNQAHKYWDIPTTLSTLYNLINKVVPASEIGISQEQKDWIDHELRNFQGTIEVLVQDCSACKGKIIVSRL